MKIYIAHNYAAKSVLLPVIDLLTKQGHQVTSRWITDDTHDGLNAETAQADIDDIDRAEALLLFTDNWGDRPGKGKYMELGYALGTNKKVFLFGRDESCVFYFLPQMVRISHLSELP